MTNVIFDPKKDWKNISLFYPLFKELCIKIQVHFRNRISISFVHSFFEKHSKQKNISKCKALQACKKKKKIKLLLWKKKHSLSFTIARIPRWCHTSAIFRVTTRKLERDKSGELCRIKFPLDPGNFLKNGWQWNTRRQAAQFYFSSR